MNRTTMDFFSSKPGNKARSQPVGEGQSVRRFVIACLADHVGPVADLIVDDALNQCGVQDQELHRSRKFLVFLKALKAELPADIDRQTVYDQLWHRALARFDFT